MTTPIQDAVALWISSGLFVEEMAKQGDAITVVVSVPGKSELHNKEGAELSGSYLASCFSNWLSDMNVKNYVAFIIRNELWRFDDEREVVRRLEKHQGCNFGTADIYVGRL